MQPRKPTDCFWLCPVCDLPTRVKVIEGALTPVTCGVCGLTVTRTLGYADITPILDRASPNRPGCEHNTKGYCEYYKLACVEIPHSWDECQATVKHTRRSYL